MGGQDIKAVKNTFNGGVCVCVGGGEGEEYRPKSSF